MSVNKTKTGYWIVTWRDAHGKGRSKSFGRGRIAKRNATAFDLEIKTNKAKGEDLPVSRAEGIYLDELTQLWIDEKKAQGRAVRWLREWAAVFNKHFLEPLCRKPAHLITQADVISVIGTHYANRAQATRNRYIGYLKATLEYGVEQNHLKRNPLARWKKGKEESHHSPLTLSGLAAIRKAAPPHLAWALEVAWMIPARPGPTDLYSLRFDKHVDYNKAGVRFFHSKVGKWAFIDLPPDFMCALAIREKQHASGHLIEYAGRPVDRLDTALDTAARRAGLPYRIRMYDVRHLWITTALDKGLEPSVIAYMAGTSVEMIHRNYYEPHAVERARAAAVMPRLSRQEEGVSGKVVGIDKHRMS